MTHYVDSRPTNVLIIKSEKQQTTYNELVNTHRGYTATLFYACTPRFFIDEMQVEQSSSPTAVSPWGPLLKRSICLGWAGVRDSAFVPVEVWMDQPGGSRLRRGGAEEQGGVKHLPTTAQPRCLQVGWGWPAFTAEEAPLCFHLLLWRSGLLCPSSRTNLSQNEKGQGHPFGDCREALWMGSPQIVDNYFVCLSKAGAAKMALANKECDLLTFRFRHLLNCVTCSSRWTHS